MNSITVHASVTISTLQLLLLLQACDMELSRGAHNTMIISYYIYNYYYSRVKLLLYRYLPKDNYVRTTKDGATPCAVDRQQIGVCVCSTAGKEEKKKKKTVNFSE